VKTNVTPTRPVMLDHFRFLKWVTRKTAKLCIPAPTYLHMRGGRKVVNPSAYPDVEEFWRDITRAYREEIADLGKAGLEYLQIDDVSFACLCDENIRAQVKRDGEDPAKLPAKYVSVINSLLHQRPKTMGVTMHTCRGNHASMWMAEGGYDAVAEAVFQTDVDGFFLEYDTARAGGFEPLRFVPKGRKVVLGLISTKTPRLEDKDQLKRRIEQAAKHIALENLCLSPQCGFASSEPGNKLTEDDQKRKLELAVEVAREVWS
jgi:5-methyltetrahydropteroyltriglutamate--homocysteine methyltransferase